MRFPECRLDQPWDSRSISSENSFPSSKQQWGGILMWNSSECQSSPVETRNRVIGAHPNSIVVLHSAGCLTKCGIALSQLSKFAWVPIHEEYNSRKTNSRNYGWHQSWFFGIFTDLLTRLHPRGKGGPEGALVWKTFKSLKLSSDRVRQTDIRWIW